MSDGYSDIYYKPSHPASFSGKPLLQQHVKPSSDLDTWFKKQDTYTLHKPARKTYERNRVRVYTIDEQWQADLVDMQAYASQNNGYRYLLTCIDIFSKFAWAIPLKKKTGVELVSALTKILDSGRAPTKFNTDQGTEFENKSVRALLKSKDIDFFTTRSDLKASVVERFNRTLKGRMWRYFTYRNTNKYIDILQEIMDAYNNAKHRSIKMAPSQVNKNNQQQVYHNLYGNTTSYQQQPNQVKFKFEVGDQVRISKQKMVFEKGYMPNWTEEIFTIAQRIARIPVVYKLKDANNDVIEGTFYEPELQAVIKEPNAAYVVEKIVQRKKQKGKNMVLVKWRGYPSSMNTWIPESDLIRL